MGNEAKTETRIEERPNNISTDVMLIQFYFEQKSKTEWSLLFNDESICPSVVNLVVVVVSLLMLWFCISDVFLYSLSLHQPLRLLMYDQM